MSWWDYGIKGRDNDVMLKSGGVSQPISGFDNISGYISCGSIVLHESTDAYPQLLITTGQGTQIYINLQAVKNPATLYFPDDTGHVYKYNNSLMLKKGSTSLTFTGGSPIGNSVLAGANSIYDAMYRTYGAAGLFDGQRIRSAAYAYPRSKSSGGATQQIGMISSSAGLDFYIVGFPCIADYAGNDYTFTAPAAFIGRIPASALNNLFWFDPDSDAVSPAEYAQMVGNGETPDRPVDYNYTGTDMDFPSLPSGASAIGFGRMKIYHPTTSQLNQILDVIWTDPTPDPSWDVLDKLVENFTKWLYKPEKYLVSLMLMPINVSGTNEKVYLGKYDTQATSPAISGQWQIVDCGTLDIPLKSNSAFDFSPHVKTMIYLPYVGFRSINVNEIMGGTIAIKYYVDMFTGSALCFVKISNSNSNNSVLYTYECNVAQQIPITSDNYNNVINSLISASMSLVSQNYGAAAAYGTNAISGLMSPDIQTSGKLNPNTGALGSEVPYIVLHFPVQSVPSGFANQNGYPSSINVMLGNLNGYTEVEKIHLDIPGATQAELDEIYSMLKSGVVL